jgi:hypothetical protein
MELNNACVKNSDITQSKDKCDTLSMEYKTSKPKYIKLNSIEDDPPYKNQNFFTITFISPEQVPKLKNIGVHGFKIKSVHKTFNEAVKASENFKSADPDFHVFIGQVGTRLPFNDDEKVDDVEYQQEELNNLNKTYMENTDQTKLFMEQCQNVKKFKEKMNPEFRRIEMMKKMRKKLGLPEHKVNIDDKKDNKPILLPEIIYKEMMDCKDTDYLDEDETDDNYKIGSITFYSKKKYINIDQFSFKFRGGYPEDRPEYSELGRHTQKLKKIDNFKHDDIHRIEIGKWTAYCETDDDINTQIIKLNYLVKSYREHLVESKKEYDERKKNMRKQIDVDNKLKKREIKKQKEKEKREAMLNSSNLPNTTNVTNTNNQSDQSNQSNQSNQSDQFDKNTHIIDLENEQKVNNSNTNIETNMPNVNIKTSTDNQNTKPKTKINVMEQLRKMPEMNKDIKDIEKIYEKLKNAGN